MLIEKNVNLFRKDCKSNEITSLFNDENFEYKSESNKQVSLVELL